MITKCLTSDLESVAGILDAAFAPSRFESALVRALVEHGREIHHWVLNNDGRIVAYVCYSRAFREEEPIGWHLAPVAVHPEWQGKGHGSDLIRRTLSQPPLSDDPVFVLGHTGYYPRFGFASIAAPQCPFDPGNTHFMALRYASADDFVIGYEQEFEEA